MHHPYGQDMGHYGDENDGEMMDYGDDDGEHEMHGYGHEMDEEDEDGESLNFDDNPEFANLPKLDRMRKIRRDILRTINDVREKVRSGTIHIDTFANKAANEYAEYLLRNPENEQQMKKICNDFHVTGVGDFVAVVGFAVLEEEEDQQGTLADNMMDAHGLVMELEEELSHLMNDRFTHIGIGFAFDKTQVKVVELLSQKHIMVNQLN